MCTLTLGKEREVGDHQGNPYQHTPELSKHLSGSLTCLLGSQCSFIPPSPLPCFSSPSALVCFSLCPLSPSSSLLDPLPPSVSLSLVSFFFFILFCLLHSLPPSSASLSPCFLSSLYRISLLYTSILGCEKLPCIAEGLSRTECIHESRNDCSLNLKRGTRDYIPEERKGHSGSACALR